SGSTPAAPGRGRPSRSTSGRRCRRTWRTSTAGTPTAGGPPAPPPGGAGGGAPPPPPPPGRLPPPAPPRAGGPPPWAETPPRRPVRDPAGPRTGSRRVMRGGAWNYTGKSCRSAVRNGLSPVNRYKIVGFRVVLLIEGG